MNWTVIRPEQRAATEAAAAEAIRQLHWSNPGSFRPAEAVPDVCDTIVDKFADGGLVDLTRAFVVGETHLGTPIACAPGIRAGKAAVLGTDADNLSIERAHTKLYSHLWNVERMHRQAIRRDRARQFRELTRLQRQTRIARAIAVAMAVAVVAVAAHHDRKA